MDDLSATLREAMTAAGLALTVRGEEEEKVCSRHSSPSSVCDDVEGSLDITKEFFDDCAKLPLGHLVKADGFHLGEAMSAIELMDPKMDIGMVRFQKTMGMQVCVQEGAYSLSDAELLTTVDATLCCFVTWLEGNNIAQSLWTVVPLTCPKEIDGKKAPVLRAMAHAFAHLVRAVKDTVQTASVYEEEDFNACLIYRVECELSEASTVDLLRRTEAELRARGKSSKSPLPGALAVRLAWLRQLMLFLSACVPRPHQQQQWSDEQREEEGGKEQPKKFKPDLGLGVECAQQCVRLAESIAGNWQNMDSPRPEGVDKDGNFGWLCCVEPELNRAHLPPTFPRRIEIIPRETALPYLVSLSRRLLRVVSELPNVVGDINSLVSFLKQFAEEDSCAFSRAALQLILLPNDDHVFGSDPLSEVVLASVRDGVAPPVTMHGSAAHSSVLCQQLWEEFICDAVKVFLVVVQTMGNNLARQREKLVVSLEDMGALQAEAERVDQECANASQAAGEHDAERGTRQKTAAEQSALPCVSTWVLQQTLSLVRLHAELGCRLQLYAEYEYQYVYWYIGEIVYKWQLNSLDRSNQMLMNDYAYGMLAEQCAASTSTGGGSKRNDKKKNNAKSSKREEKYVKRLNSLRGRVTSLYGECALANAVHMIAVALRMNGQMRVPMWSAESEALRFAHRMQPMHSLGMPLHLTYQQYAVMSRQEEHSSVGAEKLLDTAGQALDAARVHLERAVAGASVFGETMTKQAADMLKVCKHNIVVTRILKSGVKKDARIQFDFLPECPMYPMIKMVNK